MTNEQLIEVIYKAINLVHIAWWETESDEGQMWRIKESLEEAYNILQKPLREKALREIFNAQ